MPFGEMALTGAIEDEDQWDKPLHCLLEPSASQRLKESSVNSVCTSALCILRRDLDTQVSQSLNVFGSHQSNGINHLAIFTTKPKSSSLLICSPCSFLALWVLTFLQHKITRSLRTSSSKTWG